MAIHAGLPYGCWRHLKLSMFLVFFGVLASEAYILSTSSWLCLSPENGLGASAPLRLRSSQRALTSRSLLDSQFGVGKLRCTSPGGDIASSPRPPKLITLDLPGAIVFGQTGAGKSSLLNTLSSSNLFEVSVDAKRGTNDAVVHETHIPSQLSPPMEWNRWKLFDTPGNADSEGPAKDKEQVAKILTAIKEQGPVHAIIICLNNDRWDINAELWKAFSYILFGTEAYERTIVVRTRLRMDRRTTMRWKRESASQEQIRSGLEQVAGLPLVFVDSDAAELGEVDDLIVEDAETQVFAKEMDALLKFLDRQAQKDPLQNTASLSVAISSYFDGESSPCLQDDIDCVISSVSKDNFQDRSAFMSELEKRCREQLPDKMVASLSTIVLDDMEDAIGNLHLSKKAVERALRRVGTGLDADKEDEMMRKAIIGLVGGVVLVLFEGPLAAVACSVLALAGPFVWDEQEAKTQFVQALKDAICTQREEIEEEVVQCCVVLKRNAIEEQLRSLPPGLSR